MREFKIGDKVIATKQGGWYEIGEVFTLTKPYKDYGWHTEEKGEGHFIHSANMELYKPSPKSMLQNGRRVKYRNGQMFTVMDGVLITPANSSLQLCWTDIEHPTDDLAYKNNSEWDIMEIFEKPKMVVEYFEYHVPTKTLWKREEQTESEKQLKILQEQIQTLTEQAIKLGEQIKLEKL